MWSRFFETFGEDPWLTSVLGTAAVEAEQDDSVAAIDSRDVDVVVLALAEPPVVEKPGDIDDLRLPEAQLRLAQAIEPTGKPVIVTLFESRPRTIRTIVDGARAIVLGYYTGLHGGDAIARVLSGAVNPSGRLPFTYPCTVASVVHYERSVSDEVGMEVAQLYKRQMTASITPAMRKLRAFEKIELALGERRIVRVRVPVSALGFVRRNDRYAVEPGDFELDVGSRTATFVIQ
jgi:beta-glucosidase